MFETMRTRKEVKADAKEYVKNNYVMMVLMGLILAIAAGSFLTVQTRTGYSTSDGYSWGYLIRQMPLIPRLILRLGRTAALLAMIAGILARIFVLNPLQYKAVSWFRHNTDGTEDSDVLEVFRDEQYSHIVHVLFRRDLSIFLRSLLFVIPGIVRAFELYWTVQLTEDMPDRSEEEIMRISAELTRGYKVQLLLFELSFLGWEILSAMTMHLLSVFWVTPYKAMCRQLMYLDRIHAEEAMADPFLDDLRSAS